MIFGDHNIRSVHDQWLLDQDINVRAAAQNALFEERITPERQLEIEEYCKGSAGSNELEFNLAEYWAKEILLSSAPAPFRINNGSAISRPSPEQKLIRIENISELLLKISMEFDDLRRLLDDPRPASARALQWFCEQWNTRPDVRRNPVSFATFKDQHLADLASSDWPTRLRDRLGLAHLQGSPTNLIPIALMEYEVGEVDEWSRKEGHFRHSFACPVVFDQRPHPYFFPTPINTPYGCPMALAPIESEGDLVAELLHPRLAYQPNHMSRLATISSMIPRFTLDELRNCHLMAIRLDSGRDDFGAEL